MSDILDLIDGAIDAHELSADAMRWTPEPDETTQTWDVAEDFVTTHPDNRHAHFWRQDLVTWRIIMRFPPVRAPHITSWEVTS